MAQGCIPLEQERAVGRCLTQPYELGANDTDSLNALVVEWQTRQFQELVTERSCEFESR